MTGPGSDKNRYSWIELASPVIKLQSIERQRWLQIVPSVKKKQFKQHFVSKHSSQRKQIHLYDLCCSHECDKDFQIRFSS